ncbi:MAG: cytochrome C oxidase subunit IV family protein [Fidelibacterota bacterium]
MNQNASHHIVPVKVYLAVAAALMVLTLITVAVSHVNLGGFNVVVALGIASIKALLVAFFFMQLWWDKKINLIIFATALIFLTLFLMLTMFDTMTRGSIHPEMKGPINPQSPMYEKLDAGSASSH